MSSPVPPKADPAPPPAAGDDLVLPFSTVTSGMSGRLVRLGASVDEVLTRHDYPEAVARALGETMALTALLGSALNPGAKLIVQTRTDGIIRQLVVNFEHPGAIRGYASFDRERLAAALGSGDVPDQGGLLGSGHLALTIDPGTGAEGAQGSVAMDAEPIARAALSYFRQSEQLPTFLRLAVARQYVQNPASGQSAWHWRAGGLLVQHLDPDSNDPDASASASGSGSLKGERDEDWRRVEMLSSTVEDHELLDPTLSPEQLLLRLFHEEGVRAFPVRPVAFACRCSRERASLLLSSLGPEALADLKEPGGGVSVTCEFCSATYRFGAAELE